jgi:hypothetical protein
MKAYFELRQKLAEFYSKPSDWERAAEQIGLDRTLIVLPGNSLTTWSNFLGAARTPEHLASLRALIAAEIPELTPLAETYAEDVAKGEGVIADLPELQSVSLTDQDLAPATVGALLKFSETLPEPLLAMSLLPGKPNDDALDGVLAGSNTSAAKTRLANIRQQHANERALLVRRHSDAQSSLSKLESSISSIEQARQPVEPRPPETSNIPRVDYEQKNYEDYKQRQYEDYLKRHQQYQVDLSTYQANQQQLGPLRQQAEGFRRDVGQLSSELASQQVRADVDERAFVADVSRGRNEDFRLAVDRTLESAAMAIRTEKNCFRGFWTLLGASCLLDLFERTGSDAAALSGASDTFARSAEALVPSMKAGLPEIAKGCLTGPVIVNQALAINRKAFAGLQERLARSPTSELEEGNNRASRLLEMSFLPVPEYGELENPAEIDAVTLALRQLRSSVGSYIDSIKTELKGESSELRGAIDAALADARSIIDGIGKVGTENAETLEKNRALWLLIRRGDESPNLPVYVRTLCAALPQEIVRRLDTPVDALIGEAAGSQFVLKQAQAALDDHVLTNYERERKQIQQRLADSEAKLGRIEAELAVVDVKIGNVAQKYRTWMTVASGLSVVPVVGFVAAISASGLLTRVKLLMMSDKAAFVELGPSARAAMLWSTLLSGAGALVAATIVAVEFPDQYLDGSFGEIAAFATIAYSAGLALSIRNFLTAREFLRERSRLFPQPAS